MKTYFSPYTVNVVGYLTPQSRDHTGTKDCFSFMLLLQVKTGKSKRYIYCARILLPRLAAARRCHAHAPPIRERWDSIWGLDLPSGNETLHQRLACVVRLNALHACARSLPTIFFFFFFNVVLEVSINNERLAAKSRDKQSDSEPIADPGQVQM